MQLGGRFCNREKLQIAFQVKAFGSVLFSSLLFALRQADCYLSISGAASVPENAINNRGFAPNAVNSAKVDGMATNLSGAYRKLAFRKRSLARAFFYTAVERKNLGQQQLAINKTVIVIITSSFVRV